MPRDQNDTQKQSDLVCTVCLGSFSRLVLERGMCIKGLFSPPLEQKTENCFSPISFDWFIRRITEVSNFRHLFKFYRCYGNKNG